METHCTKCGNRLDIFKSKCKCLATPVSPAIRVNQPAILEKVDDMFRYHGLAYKAKNPIEHKEGEPVCGLCHHIDVLGLKHGVSYLIENDREAFISTLKAIKAMNKDPQTNKLLESSIEGWEHAN